MADPSPVSSEEPLFPVPTRRPVPAVISVVLREGYVLMVQRANPPDALKWGFPGGKVEWGEAVSDAVLRELSEETGVVAEAGPVIDALDAFDIDDAGIVRHHHILIAVLCHWVRGEPKAADDAKDARWLPLAELETCGLVFSKNVIALARRADTLLRELGRS